MNKIAVAVIALMSCSPDPTPPPRAVAPDAAMMAPAPKPSTGDLIKFEAPEGWVKEEPNSKLRKAQYKVPDKSKKAGDASLALFYFGPNNEMLQENLKRWATQMGAADPKPEILQGKCKITLVDLSGTYTGDQQNGPQENARLLAAVVEDADGPWYFKLVGPADTVGPWKDEYLKMLKAAGGK